MDIKNSTSFILTLVFLVSSIAIHEDSKADIIESKVASTIVTAHDAHVKKYQVLTNEAQQLSLLSLTLSQLKHQTDAEINLYQCRFKQLDEFAYSEKPKFFNGYSNTKTSRDESIIRRTRNHQDIDQMHTMLPIFEALDNNKINLQNLPKSDSPKVDSELNTDLIGTEHIGYWQTVHSIESKQGKLLYRPRNKSRNCSYTLGPCGHHQLTVKALKDIGCKSLQCRKDRLDFKKSLKFSKKLLALNEERLLKNGISKLEDYQKYLIHQQGAYGIKSIIAATKGKKVLSKNLKKNMANNSPYSYRQLKNMGSKAAAKKFMQHWENKWVDEKVLIVASQTSASTDNLKNPDFIPRFNDSELKLALNIRF